MRSDLFVTVVTTRLAQVGHHQEAELGSIDRLGAPLF
jgi:hypothetical protein